MAVQVSQSSGVMRSRRILRRVSLFSLILIPFLWSCIIRIVLREEAFLQIISFYKTCFWHGGFWSVENDSTAYCAILSGKGGLLGGSMVLHGTTCFIACIVLVYRTVKKRIKHLIPFVIPYSILAILLFLAVLGDYSLPKGVASFNILMLYGAYIRFLHGALPVALYLATFAGYMVYLFIDIKLYQIQKENGEKS